MVHLLVDGPNLSLAGIQGSTSEGNKTWRTAYACVDVREFVAAVKRKIPDDSTAVADEWIGNQVVAEILQITETAVWALVKHGHLERKGPSLQRGFSRKEVEEFREAYMLVPEILPLLPVPRARDVRVFLADRYVEPVFQIREDRGLIYRRHEVMAVVRHLGDVGS